MTASLHQHDERYMRRALLLAERGRGRVEPNPVVGCVLVGNGRIVGEGYHRRYGGPHAEVWALRQAGKHSRGATAYVTLEPCCHFGKTPPCTDALIAAGVRRVVAAMNDPFEQVAGQGFQKLRAAGMDVSAGLLATESMRMNGPYLVRQHLARPWVILKWAQSLDGKIATRTGDSQWISSEASRAWAHRLRGRMDAIVVGIGTVLADDPLLTCRAGRPKRLATRIVLDPSLRLPVTSRLVHSASQIPTLAVTRPASESSPRGKALRRAGVALLPVRCGTHGLDLRELLRQLAQRGMSNILVEGGGETLGRFRDAALADEAVVFISPRLIGGRAAVPALGGEGPKQMSRVYRPVSVERRSLGGDECYRLLLTDPAKLAPGK